MFDLWRAVIAWLVWLSADPQAVTVETPRAAAAVAVAYAALTPEPDAPPKPPKPVGPVTLIPDCPGGTCRVPGASPAIVSPARP